MSLLTDLQNDLANSSASLTGALRKAQILAYRLDNDDLKAWVQNELNGYPDQSIPDYRRLPAVPFGNFTNSVWQATDTRIPLSAVPEKFRDLVTQHVFSGGISSIETLLADSQDNIKLSLAPEFAQLLSGKVYNGMQCISVWKTIGRGNVMGLVETVRNKLLTLLLELGKQFPELAKRDDNFATISSQEVQAMIPNNIYGSQNVIASGSHFTQNIQKIEQGNLDSLVDALKAIGLDNQEIDELKLAIKEDGDPTEEGRFGSRITTFLGKLASKAVTSMTQGATSAAAAQALSHYFGWGVN